MTELIRISASRLKTFRTCQRQHYYKYLLHKEDRPDQEKTVASLLGSGVHKAIEMYYKEKANPTLTFQEYMLNTYAEWEQAGVQIKGEEYLAKSLKDGKDMLKKMDFDRWNPTSIELRFNLPFPNEDTPIALMDGVIDIVDISGDFADHKSSNRVPAQDKLDHDPQFLIYAWAYIQISNGYRPGKIYWNHLRTGKLIEVNVFHNYEFKLEQLTREIKALINTKNDINTAPRRMLDDVCIKECSFYSLCYADKAPVNIIEDIIED